MCISYLLRLKQMEEYLLRNGWEKTDSTDNADCLLIGACAAFEPYFGAYADQLRKPLPPGCRVVVYGCLPIVERDFYRKHTPTDAFLIPTREPQKIENVIKPLNASWSEIGVPSAFREADYQMFDSRRRYILIQEGCTEKCHYCPHRLGIGSAKSRSLEQIVRQVGQEIESGGTVFILEGNDGGSWGLDLSPPSSYPRLLEAVLGLSGTIELHIGDFSPKWVKLYADSLEHKQITDIKIPIQTVSSRLLEAMGRNPYALEMAPLLQKLKNSSRPPVLRTEIIIGLPTSTEAELIQTLEFAASYFHKIACFSYDFHPYTRIARMEMPLHDEATLIRHVQIAMDFASQHPEVGFVFNERGKICAMLTSQNHETASSSQP